MLTNAAPREYAPPQLMQRYLLAVRWCLAHRKTKLGLTVAFLAGSIALIPMIPSGFVPVSDRGFVTINVELPPGSALDSTLAVERDARQALDGIPGIQRIFSVAGGNATTSFDSAQTVGARFGTMTLMLAPRGVRQSQATIEARAQRRLANVRGARFSLGNGGLSKKLKIVLTSDNTPVLTERAARVAREMRGIPGLSNVASSASREQPEIEIWHDMALAAERGISTAAIGETVRIATTGDFDAQLARLNLDDRQIFLRVQLSDREREHVGAVSGLRVKGRGCDGDGHLLRLSAAHRATQGLSTSLKPIPRSITFTTGRAPIRP